MEVVLKSYLQAIGKIGEGIEKTGADFGKLSSDFSRIQNPTLQDIKDLKRGYELSLEEFKSLELILSNLEAPEVLKSGHTKLIHTFGKYVTSRELAIQSLDTVNGVVNKALYEESKNKHEQSVKEIVATTNEMVAEVVKVK